MNLLKLPNIIFQDGTVVATSFAMSFLQVTQKDHLQSFHLSPLYLDVVLTVGVVGYGVSVPLWGRLTDNDLASTTVTTIGSIIQVIAFLLLGPAPFIPVEKSLVLCIIALFLRGIGNAAVLVST